MSEQDDYWRIQAADVLTQLHEVERANADLSRQIGELHTTIGYQDAMLPALRRAAIDLLNQLALAAGDDQTYFWKIGGRPLDAAMKALKDAVEDTKVSNE